MFRIRPATSADQSFISEMQYEAFFVPPGAQPFPRSILEQPNIRRYHADFGSQAGDAGVIAETQDGRPLGAAWVRHVDGYGVVDAETPELGIAVVASARGTGIGAALLRELFAVVPRCSLSVDTRNAAIGLYERFGFETVRAEGDHTLVMLRQSQPT
jgi:ribosomal protein S18 acetylase RimI-like enzyme